VPFVKDHNTILLTNHGIVCWSDTATHAEWLVEIVDTCCKTYLIARQTGQPLCHIPETKIQEILALKRRLGFPDARMSHMQEQPGTAAETNTDLERLVEQVVTRLEEQDR